MAALLPSPQQNLAALEALWQMLGGAAGSLMGLPSSVIQTLMGRASPEMLEKYPGLKPYKGKLTSGELAGILSQSPVFAPKTELGKQYSENVGKGGQKLEDWMREGSGFIPSMLDKVPGEHDYLAHLADQALYLGASVVSPTKAVRGVTSAVKGGFYPVAMSPRLNRQQTYGPKTVENPLGGTEVPWYTPMGRGFQIPLMAKEFLQAKVANFLKPKSAYLSEQKGISSVAAKELKRLEQLIDQFTGKPDAIFAPTGKKRRFHRAQAVNDYVNQWANVVSQAKIYRPDHPALKNLGKDFMDELFPNYQKAKMSAVESNPQIIGGRVLKSNIPDGVIRHVLDDMKATLKIGAEDIEFARKPTEPYGGAGVRNASMKGKVKKIDGIPYEQNPYVSLIGSDASPGIIRVLNERGSPITKNDIIAEAKKQNDSITNPSGIRHDVKMLEKNLQRGDGYLSFGWTTLTPDRLLAHLTHRWVFDPDTGKALLFNYDHVKFGSPFKWLDKFVDIGAKERLVVMDVMNFDNILGKGVSDIPAKWGIQTVGEVLPKSKGPRIKQVREKAEPHLYAEPPSEFVAGRTAESYGYPAAIAGPREIGNEDRKARNIY